MIQPPNSSTVETTDYNRILACLTELLDVSRRASARVVNSLMTATYWEIGRRIVEHEQGGQKRAEYGEALLEGLSRDLTRRFGRGFGIVQLRTMRQFYSTHAVALPADGQIHQSAIGESSTPTAPKISEIGQSSIDELVGPVPLQQSSIIGRLSQIARRFPLPWTHYVRLLRVRNPEAREFYSRGAMAGGWSVRQLDRQIGSQFYERSALSKDKSAMLVKGGRAKPGDVVTADEEIRNPLVLEFLNLKDEYSETDLEDALVRHLESFLLELGDDFAFLAKAAPASNRSPVVSGGFAFLSSPAALPGDHRSEDRRFGPRGCGTNESLLQLCAGTLDEIRRTSSSRIDSLR